MLILLLTKKNITFGITINASDPKTQVKNFMIFIGNDFIFRNKCLKTPLVFVHFKSYLIQRLNIEKQIHFMKDKITQFYRKWNTLTTLTN